MPTIKGTYGDTTGALVTNITTPEQLTAMIQPATHLVDGALLAADKAFIDAIAAQLGPSQTFATLDANAVGLEVFATPTVSWTATGVVAFTMPLKAGKRFYPVVTVAVMATRSAASLTGTMTIQYDQNGAAISTQAALSAATANTALTLPMRQSVAPTQTTFPDMTTYPMQIEITSAFSGATATGYWLMAGFYA